MKKLLFLSLTIAMSYAVSAQHFDWATSIMSGGTNVYTGFMIDNAGDPVVAGGSEDYGGGAPNGFVIAKRKQSDGSVVFTKKYNGSNGSKCYRMFTDADNNIYYLGSFYGSIDFGAKTLHVSNQTYWDREDILIAKFDPNGNHIWSHNLGLKAFEETNESILGAGWLDNQIVFMVSFGADSLFYDIDFVKKLDYPGQFKSSYYVVRVDSNGTLNKFERAAVLQENALKAFKPLTNGQYEALLHETYPRIQLTKLGIAADLSLSRLDSIELKGLSPNSFEIGQIVPQGEDYYITIVGTSGEGIVVGETDTLANLPTQYNLRSAYLLKLNATFDLAKSRRFQWTAKYPWLRVSKDKVILASRFFNTMLYSPDDSIVSKNNQHANAVVVMDTDLSPVDAFQVNTNNSSGAGFDFRDAHCDSHGNLYTLFTHGKDLTFGDITVQAALKSWDHLTALCKRGSGSPAGLGKPDAADERLTVYPNPSNDLVSIGFPDGRSIRELQLFGSDGRCLNAAHLKEGTMEVSHLPAGVYFLLAKDRSGRVFKGKFVRQ